jgi:hypothetical protein
MYQPFYFMILIIRLKSPIARGLKSSSGDCYRVKVKYNGVTCFEKVHLNRLLF